MNDTAAAASIEAILVATRRVIAERGPDHVRMSAIATAAGVSRPTLYKWFPTKEQLLLAFRRYEEEQFDLRLREAIDAQRTPARKLDAALRLLVTYLDGRMGPDPIGVDPASAIHSLARGLERQRESLVRQLGDAFDAVPAVQRGHLAPAHAADLLLRVAYSHYLLPHPEPEVLLADLRALAGLPRRSMTRATG